MKLGTPGFAGARLREAREARGMTEASLAELIGITRSAVSLYETGGVSPQPEVMENIAERLNLPISYFLMPPNQNVDNTIFFRSMASATKMARARGLRRYEWLCQMVVPLLKEYVKFPHVNFPKIDVPNNPIEMSYDDIEAIATDARRYWNLGDGTISDIVLLLENNGAITTRMELYADNLDAFSTWRSEDNTPYIVLGADKGSAVRSRFDAAHELGHLVLHRNIKPKYLNNSSDFKFIESQAHRFASAFLVPASTFADSFYAPTLDSFRVLKSKWLVAIGVLIRRAKDLSFIDGECERRLWINYNRRGWRRSEPLDDKLPIEKPRLLRRAIELLLSDNVLTLEQFLSQIPLNARDVEELTNLTYGYLSVTPPALELTSKSLNMEAIRLYKGKNIYSKN